MNPWKTIMLFTPILIGIGCAGQDAGQGVETTTGVAAGSLVAPARDGMRRRDVGGVKGFPGSYYGDEADSVRDDEMGTFLTESIATLRRVVILDTCNSGGFIGNTLEVDTTHPTTSTTWRPGFSLSTIAKAIAAYATFTTTSSTGISPYQAQVLSAAGSGEYSYETSGYGHGVMTYFLLKTAAKGDLNGDGVVTVLEAFSLVKAGIEEDWNAEHPMEAFTPHVSGGAVDFVLF